MEYVEVEDVSSEFYSGKVYDLSIPIDHSYRISGFTVHNSAGGSLVACALGITKWCLDPLENNLLFERFVSDSRLPDCVIDYTCKDVI